MISTVDIFDLRSAFAFQIEALKASIGKSLTRLYGYKDVHELFRYFRRLDDRIINSESSALC